MSELLMKTLLLVIVSIFVAACDFDDPHTLNIYHPERSGAAYSSGVPGGVQSKFVKSPIFDFEIFDIEGQPLSLNRFKGKVLLVVNTASRCGYTPQYGQLQALYEQYREEGLDILAFPSNDFGGQELITNEDIALFCYTRYAVDFPLFAKTRVRGKNKHPLYRYLTEFSPYPGEVRWNFEKFLINRNGQVVARYPSSVVPLSEEIEQDLKRVLPVDS